MCVFTLCSKNSMHIYMNCTRVWLSVAKFNFLIFLRSASAALRLYSVTTSHVGNKILQCYKELRDLSLKDSAHVWR